uniref:Uncharacterized protein n=1 Tax=Strombidium inclinatum TaxID=197538 RepID=A0A7S3IXQ6_9SPIT
MDVDREPDVVHEEVVQLLPRQGVLHAHVVDRRRKQIGCGTESQVVHVSMSHVSENESVGSVSIHFVLDKVARIEVVVGSPQDATRLSEQVDAASLEGSIRVSVY